MLDRVRERWRSALTLGALSRVALQDEGSEDLRGEGVLQGYQLCWRDEDALGMA
jgi:hypothetical protein